MPQPIDVNTELGRVMAAERIAQIADRTSLAAQARAQEEVELQRQNAETQVRNADAKSEDVDAELHRRAPYVGRRRRKRQGAGDARDGRGVPDAGELPVIQDDTDQHGLDITI